MGDGEENSFFMGTLRLFSRGMLLALLAGVTVLSGCSKSYPADSLKESLIEICRKEYGIDNVQVEIAGDTLGVYLPFGRLFSADLKDAMATGKVQNMESLFQPSAEAIEKIEDLLFALSRVMMSTDIPLRFYELQVTDVDHSGLELTLTGFLDDIKRVRIWDISRNEYRNRILHEIHLNQAVVWHSPVRKFFSELGDQPLNQVRKKYLGDSLSLENLKHLFFDALPPDEISPRAKIDWEIEDIRSVDLDKTGAVVYVRVQPQLKGEKIIPLSEDPLEFLFIVSIFADEEPHIVRVIPFQYRDDQGKWTKISFPSELQLEKNLSEWRREFMLEPLHLGTFLARQLTRRVQADLATDERIHNTFRSLKIGFDYVEKPRPGRFSMNIQAKLHDESAGTGRKLLLNEDMLYAVNLALREFVDLVQNYRFGDYQQISLNLSNLAAPEVLSRDQLELFRRKEIDTAGLLSFVKV